MPHFPYKPTLRSAFEPKTLVLTGDIGATKKHKCAALGAIIENKTNFVLYFGIYDDIL